VNSEWSLELNTCFQFKVFSYQSIIFYVIAKSDLSERGNLFI